MSKVAIVNKALTHLGAARITSLSDDSVESQSASNMYNQSLRSVLAECDWKFATKKVLLNKLDIEPAWNNDGKLYYYQLPDDFVEIFGVMDESAKWEREGETILTDAAKTFGIKYVYFCDNTSLYTPSFIDAFACKLAADMCYELTNSESKTMNLLQLYKGEYLPVARTKNARAGNLPKIKDDHWVKSVTGIIYD